MNKCPDAIITADWHIREDIPKCRADTFLDEQERKLLWIKELHNGIIKDHLLPIPILNAGDLFNHWKPSPWLISLCLSCFPKLIYTIPGNHDLPAHNLNRIKHSGLWTLHQAGKIKLLNNLMTIRPRDVDWRITAFPFGIELKPADGLKHKSKEVALVHKFVYRGRKPFPGATGGASGVMKKLKGFDLIVTGDNHQPFTYKNKQGQLLVNPGSLMRQTAGQANDKPRVYLWYAKENEVEPIYIPIEKNVVSREHLDKENERNDRIQAYIEMLDGGINPLDLGLDFEANLKKYVTANKISRPIKNKIYEAMEK